MMGKRKNKDWSNVNQALGNGICKFCKRFTYNVLHIGRYLVCADCVYILINQTKKEK